MTQAGGQVLRGCEPPQDEGAARVRARLEEAFGRIARERMAGLPMMNERLRVQAFGFERLGEWRVGVLLTPWFMNLMLLPAEGGEDGEEGIPELAGAIGETRTVALPAGRVDCIIGGEEGVGRWLFCSLFSPVFEFADHAAAADTARAALEMLLTPPVREDATGGNDAEDDAAALEDAFAGGFARVAAGAQRRRLRGEQVPGSEREQARRAEERERRAAEEQSRARKAREADERRAAAEGVDLRRRALLFGRAEKG